MSNKVVIVGGGQAGFQTAASLRSGKFDDAITILGEESALPYQRPPLSKGYIKGEASESSVLLRPASFYAANAIDVRLESRVAAIDRARNEVVQAGGERVPYDSLVLATGARAPAIRGSSRCCSQWSAARSTACSRTKAACRICGPT